MNDVQVKLPKALQHLKLLSQLNLLFSLLFIINFILIIYFLQFVLLFNHHHRQDIALFYLQLLHLYLSNNPVINKQELAGAKLLKFAFLFA